MLRLSWLAPLMACCVACSLTGCSKDDDRVKVSGMVTWKGDPVKNGTISFLKPGDPAPSGAAAITNGKFEVVPKGLLPGNYKVLINYPDLKGGKPVSPDSPPGEPAATKELIPSQYNSDTKLTADVVPNGPPLSFDLK